MQTNGTENRIEELLTTIEVNAATLSSEEFEKLIARVDRVVERLCTVKRSLNAGVAASSTLVNKA